MRYFAAARAAEGFRDAAARTLSAAVVPPELASEASRPLAAGTSGQLHTFASPAFPPESVAVPSKRDPAALLPQLHRTTDAPPLATTIPRKFLVPRSPTRTPPDDASEHPAAEKEEGGATHGPAESTSATLAPATHNPSPAPVPLPSAPSSETPIGGLHAYARSSITLSMAETTPAPPGVQSQGDSAAALPPVPQKHQTTYFQSLFSQPAQRALQGTSRNARSSSPPPTCAVLAHSAVPPARQEISGTGTPSSCLLYTSPSPRDRQKSRMPSSA